SRRVYWRRGLLCPALPPDQSRQQRGYDVGVERHAGVCAVHFDVLGARVAAQLPRRNLVVPGVDRDCGDLRRQWVEQVGAVDAIALTGETVLIEHAGEARAAESRDEAGDGEELGLARQRVE